LLCALFGLLTIIRNEACYDGSFSTIYRYAKATRLGVDIGNVDLDGKSPLPGYLGKTQVLMREDRGDWDGESIRALAGSRAGNLGCGQGEDGEEISGGMSIYASTVETREFR
jgi:hypothetical protein